MSNTSENSDAGGCLLVVLLAAGAFYLLSGKDKAPENLPMVPPPAPVASLPAPMIQPSPVSTTAAAPKPAHFYSAAEGVTYYYAAAVSEEGRKSGQRAPNMLAFRYLGRNESGQDMIQDVINGYGSGISTCSRPCKVIHQPDGSTLGFDDGSIIGAAFADAQRGFLKKYISPKPTPTPTPTSEPQYQVDNDGNLVPIKSSGQ